MKSEYLFCLYYQYCKSAGKKYDKFNILNDTDFVEWVSRLYKQTKMYGDYLSFLDINLSDETAIEINKGKYDSLGLKLVSVVSSFGETFGLNNGRLIIYDDRLLVLMSSSIFKVDNCDLFLTHNPYDICDIDKIKQLHDLGLNICLGMYGRISDKDRETKVKKLHSMANETTDVLGFYYDTADDDYFACVKSERKVKELIK